VGGGIQHRLGGNTSRHCFGVFEPPGASGAPQTLIFNALCALVTLGWRFKTPQSNDLELTILSP
jgi:hypothetical protein